MCASAIGLIVNEGLRNDSKTPRIGYAKVKFLLLISVLPRLGLTNFKNSEKNGENSLFSAISKCTYNANFDFSVGQITLEQKFSSSLIFAKSEFYSEKKCDDVEDVGRSIYFLPPPPLSILHLCGFSLCSPHYHYVYAFQH